MNNQIKWIWKKFSELSTFELYQIIALREEVFVVEQKLSYVDCDGYDLKAWHLMGFQNNELVAYLRAFAPKDKYEEAAFGRVAVKSTQRGTGLGRELTANGIKNIEQTFGLVPTRISAQAHLEGFYSSFGFKTDSQVYLEEGIPHIQMLKP